MFETATRVIIKTPNYGVMLVPCGRRGHSKVSVEAILKADTHRRQANEAKLIVRSAASEVTLYDLCMEFAEQLGTTPLLYNQKLGCSCGCSPGFAAHPIVLNGRQFDVHVKRVEG